MKKKIKKEKKMDKIQICMVRLNVLELNKQTNRRRRRRKLKKKRNRQQRKNSKGRFYK